jgi:hypothetical protein
VSFPAEQLNENKLILFSESSGLMRVPADGGKPVAVTTSTGKRNCLILSTVSA